MNGIRLSLCCAVAMILHSAKIWADDFRTALFAIPEANFSQSEVLSERIENGVKVQELMLSGPDFQGSPTKIYAWYACPLKPGRYPGVVQLHGSGLQKLEPGPAIGYARENYACLSIDWSGEDWKAEGKLRSQPRSDFRSSGNHGRFMHDGSGDPKKGHWVAVSPEESSITNGVRFVRRAFQYLRSRPDVDSEKLCLSGMSAGAHLALLVLQCEPDLKAAAIKYGSGYIRELNWGGYFGPLSRSDKVGAERWLAALDPKHGLDQVKAATLILTGTDDIFFFLPAVLATWRSLPEPKGLLVLPNDNHGQVSNEKIPRQWFSSVLEGRPTWPKIAQPRADLTVEGMKISVNATNNISQMDFWYKRQPAAEFFWGKGKNPDSSTVWKKSAAVRKIDGRWEASLPPFQAGEQIIVYALATGEDGVQTSSDTLEIPEYPSWRKTK